MICLSCREEFEGESAVVSVHTVTSAERGDFVNSHPIGYVHLSHLIPEEK